MAEPVALVFAGAYAVSLVVLLVWARAIPPNLRRYCYPFVALTGLAALAQLLSGFAVGTVPLGSSTLDIPNAVEGGFVYALLFGFAAFLGGATRRQLAVATAVPLVMSWSFYAAALGDGALVVVPALIVVGGYVALCWLFVHPIWRTASRLPERRSRLFWKFRNLLLFLIGVLIFSAFTSLGAFTETVGNIIVNYIDLLLRVGFSAFLFANIDVFRDVDSRELAERESGRAVPTD